MDYNSSKNQNIKRKFVDRDVIYCVSMLVHELAGYDGDMNSELWPVLVQDDWEEPMREHILDWDIDECRDYLNDRGVSFEGHNDVSELCEMVIKDAIDDPQDFCEGYNIEPYVHEALEHWIVTEWLADKLEAQGEMVLRDFMGLTIWGRCGSGQAILLDRVIGKICEEMGILEGQENEWKVD